MKKEHLHLEGPALSRIVAGVWRWNGTGADIDALINTSLDVGITSFDHSDIYGDYENQKAFGAVLKRVPSLRPNIQLISKCGIRLLSSKHPETGLNITTLHARTFCARWIKR